MSKQQSPIIILVAPQMGENIGATARAMKNFNVSELRIVSPRDRWPNEQARAMAVSAVNIIDNAKIYDNLEASIADIDYLYATSSAPRSINKNYVLSKDLAQEYPANLKVGIMFGRENCGLKNSEITYANKIININTGDFDSLNIAQSVIIICYELFHNIANSDKLEVRNEEQGLAANRKVTSDDARQLISIDYNQQISASRGELGYFFEHLFDELDKKSFFKVHEKKVHMTQNIKNIFTRIDKLSKSELQTLRGIIATLSSNKI